VKIVRYEKDMMNRLKRLEGQVRGVIKMMEEDKGCRDVVTQLSAVRSAADRTIGLIVAKNLEQCIIEANDKGTSTEDAIQEAVSMLVKSR
jgi:DNA-binding FrmR family transcriptional regulator